MTKDNGRTTIDLKSSLCTDNPTGSDVYPFTADPTQVVQNTGMERAGGITSIYEQETTFATAGLQSLITKSGDLLQVDASNNIRINDQIIGNVGPLAIKNRGMLGGSYLDAAWTADETIITINRLGTTIIVSEIDPATDNVLHSRSITFAGMPSSVLNICLVKYVDMHYVDNQEFIAQFGGSGPGSFGADVLRESGATTTAVTGVSSNFVSVCFCWRFTAGKYVYGETNNYVLSYWFIGDLTASTTALFAATFCYITIDRFIGTAFSRAVFHFSAFKNAANQWTGVAEVGYTSAGVYSATLTYYGIALAAVTATATINICGQGYSENTFVRSDTGATIYYYYASPFAHNAGAYYLSDTSNTHTAILGYGKLTDLFNATTGANNNNLVAWRIGFTGLHRGGDFISAAPVGTTQDCIGVPITNIGEYDSVFPVLVDDDGSTHSRIIYRSQGNLFWVNITSTATHTIQKVSDDVYIVNCLSALNAIVVSSNKLVTGTNDYNGRLIYHFAGSGATTKIAALVQGSYSNSIDLGDKLITPNDLNIGLFGTTLFCPGTNAPSFWDRSNDFVVNVFFADSYLGGFLNNSSPLFDDSKTGLLYVPDTRLPVGMGYTFFDGHTMQTEIETIFMGVGITGSGDIDYDYVCYELGNDTLGQFQSFTLYGQSFLFDGKNVWLASFTGSLFNGKGNQPMAVGTGLSLIAVSPTEAFFLSSFDNSLYSFNGGRSLAKAKRMNDLRNSANAIESIINGVFNIRDNALLLQTASSFVWVRDGVVTQNQKKANQTAIGLFDTANGIQIANTTTKWVYSFAALSNSTVVPLTWQSAFHSLKANELSVATAWIVTLYSPGGRISAPVTLTCYSFDQENYSTNKGTITIQPSWWDGLGFCRIRIQPQTEKSLASSVQIDTSVHLTITDVTVLYGDDAQAIIAGTRSI